MYQHAFACIERETSSPTRSCASSLPLLALSGTVAEVQQVQPHTPSEHCVHRPSCLSQRLKFMESVLVGPQNSGRELRKRERRRQSQRLDIEEGLDLRKGRRRRHGSSNNDNTKAAPAWLQRWLRHRNKVNASSGPPEACAHKATASLDGM